MPPFDTRLRAADLEWGAFGLHLLLCACCIDSTHIDLAMTGLIASGQSDRRGPAARKVCNARERAQRRFLQDVSVLIPGRDWEAQPLPGARARRRGEGPQVRCAGDEDNQRQFDEKDIYYFHQKGGAL